MSRNWSVVFEGLDRDADREGNALLSSLVSYSETVQRLLSGADEAAHADEAVCGQLCAISLLTLLRLISPKTWGEDRGVI